MRIGKATDKLDAKGKELAPLDVGDVVRVQNQHGQFPKKWDRTGTVVMVKENDQYLVRIDGSRQLSPRNRRFLRKIVPLSMASKQEILVPPITKENVDPSPPRGRPLRADPTSPIPQ